MDCAHRTHARSTLSPVAERVPQILQHLADSLGGFDALRQNIQNETNLRSDKGSRSRTKALTDAITALPDSLVIKPGSPNLSRTLAKAVFALLKTNQQADADADAADAACYRTPAKRRKLDVAKDCTPKMDCDPACDTP